MTALAQFAAFLSGAAPRDLADAERGALALHVIDTAGAWIAAARTPEGGALLRFRAALPAAGERPDPSLDIMTHCALARLSEVDDIHLASMTTPGAIVIPAALTLAARLPETDTAALPAAIVAGYEAMVRLGRALDGPSILYRGIWPTYFAAPFGVAAVAARLLRIDAAQTAHALALALAWAAPGVGHHNAATGARWLSAGHAARNGLMATLAAKAGFTSDLDLFGSGFFDRIYGIAVNADALTRNLGESTALDEVSFKPWCAARQTMGATQALKDILAAGVPVNAIESVEAFVLPPHLRMIDHGVAAGDRASHLTSLPFQLARAALAPDAMLDIGQSPAQVPEDFRGFMARVAVAPDEALLADYPRAWPARVVVTARSGRYERSVMHVPGDPTRPFGADEVVDKCRHLVSAAGEDADELLDLCRDVVRSGQSPNALLRAIERVCETAISRQL